MKPLFVWFAFFLFMLFCKAPQTSAFVPQDPKDFNVVISDLAKKLQESNTSDKPQRLAVVTFVPSQNRNENAKNDFGEYVTESVISALSSNKKIFKLFERKRLDAVLKENDLMLTDLMQKEAAIKVGELVPIDALFSGTYTKLKNYIDINGRMIDVVSGEIIVSVSGRIKLTEDLLSLFPDESKTTNTKTSNGKNAEENPCENDVRTVKSLLNDLTTDDKIQNVAKTASKIPFDMACGRIHFEIMSIFQRYKMENAGYKKFLMSTLDTIAFPASDDRALLILIYLASDNEVDDAEWSLGFKAIKKIGNHRLYVYLRKLLNSPPLPENTEKIQNRIDEFCNAALSNQVGLPVPMNFNAAFFQLLSGLRNDKDNRLVLYAYDSYGRHLDMDPKAFDKLATILAEVYKDESDGQNKTTIIKWLADLYNQSEKSNGSAESLYGFAGRFEPNSYNKEEIKRTYPEKDLKFLVSLCRDKFTDYAMLTKYNSQLEDRINFCVKYDIPIPGTIPTMVEAQTILEGNDWEEQLRVMKLLVQMDERPKTIEKTLVKILDKRSLDHKGELSQMQELTLVILGNIRTNDPKVIGYMIASLESREYMIPDKAVDALVRIGKGAVPALIAKLNSLTIHDGGLQYQVAVILGRIGKDARAAKPSLQTLLAKTSNKDIKYAIEAALQAME